MSWLIWPFYVLQIIEEYLPHICAILNCVAHDEIGIKAEPSVYTPLYLSKNCKPIQ